MHISGTISSDNSFLVNHAPPSRLFLLLPSQCTGMALALKIDVIYRHVAILIKRLYNYSITSRPLSRKRSFRSCITITLIELIFRHTHFHSLIHTPMPHYTTAFSSSDCTAEQRLREERKGKRYKKKENIEKENKKFFWIWSSLMST